MSPGAAALGWLLLDKSAVFVGPNAIKASTEVGVLAANGFAWKDGPDLVLLDGQGLKEVLRAQKQNSAAQNSAD